MSIAKSIDQRAVAERPAYITLADRPSYPLGSRSPEELSWPTCRSLQVSSLPLHTLDLVILVLSIVAVTLFGMYVGRKEEGTSDYFLAGKSVAWWAVAGSIFGTNISSHHMVGMMGAGLKEGFAQANFEFGAICGLLMLCYFFLPLYRRMGVYTLSEFLGRRYDDRCRLLYSVSNIAFLLIQMCGTLILGRGHRGNADQGNRLCDQL